MKIIQKDLDIDFSKSIKMISLLNTFQNLPIDKIISILEKEKINFELKRDNIAVKHVPYWGIDEDGIG